MSAAPVPLISNHLLQLLNNTARQALLQHCDVVQLQFADILCQSNQTYQYLYFPLSGFISLVTKLDNHKPLELGIIGNEGMLGATLALNVSLAPMQAVVQGKGSAWRISLAKLQQCIRQCPQLKQVLQQYLFVQLGQLAQNVACAHFHELRPRLARWLLMSHDRAHSSSFYLTHQFLAGMLGARRSGVTVAAGMLQQQQIISYSRGMISILDRQALQGMACECYQAALDDYHRMLGEPAPDDSNAVSAS
ncbi:Crp/Fnr family transcriptional regulator [Arsukibacterium ikkense]|uniref:Crp/Fnr family transcriptional regulator n=1 Tax=Arsukibacterium ikkense TaxID=336831 RepID=A0A0M2V7K5_9GAMM|nr:Crp/Fnr family transcriptional regulator [Arsukibacterium ikkense]KKO45123.1 Crp/Fnr family transcriptional regulator [Arsukibacterium ikkense]